MTRLVSVASVAAILVALVLLSGPEAISGAPIKWSLFAELQRPRAFASAVALPTGEILVVGGLDKEDPAVTNPNTELLDPITRSDTLLPQTILPRLHQTVTLSREDVVVAGGVIWEVTHWTPVDRVDVYDAAHRSWRVAAPLHFARSDAAAVTLRDGRVAVFGGNFDTRLMSSVEIYDPKHDVWTAGAPMPRPRTQHTAVLLKDGKVLVVGGIDTDGGPTNSTFVYDPASNTWDYGPRTNEARFQQATVALRGGDFLFIGGDGQAAGTSERYVASEGRFVVSGQLTEGRLVAQAAALPDGRVVVTGGLPLRMTSYRPLDSVEVWDPATGLWTEVAPLKEGRAWGTLLRVGHALYLVSGNGTDEAAFSTVERLTID